MNRRAFLLGLAAAPLAAKVPAPPSRLTISGLAGWLPPAAVGCNSVRVIIDTQTAKHAVYARHMERFIGESLPAIIRAANQALLTGAYVFGPGDRSTAAEPSGPIASTIVPEARRNEPSSRRR